MVLLADAVVNKVRTVTKSSIGIIIDCELDADIWKDALVMIKFGGSIPL